MSLFVKRQLLEELQDRVAILRIAIGGIKHLTEQEFATKPHPNAWSIAEVLAHVNITHNIYIKSIHERIQQPIKSSQLQYKSSWLGDWFYKMIRPKPDGTVVKMKAPSFLQASSSELNGSIEWEKFDNQLYEIELLLDDAFDWDLQRIKVPLSFTKLISLRLGDVLRFMVAHNERHWLQIQRTLDQIKASTPKVAS